MAGYNLRRGPNVSQYIANLNAIPTAQEIEAQHNENFSLEDDLAMFTNAEFFNFDLGQNVEQVGVNYDPARDGRAKRGNASTEDEHGEVTGLDLNHGMHPNVLVLRSTLNSTPWCNYCSALKWCQSTQG